MSNSTPPVADPLGEKTAATLLSMFQDAYRQEIGAEEDVHRTLPFFATALGLIIAAINYAAGQLPPWDALTKACPNGHGELLNHHVLACGWPVLLAALLLAIAAMLGIAVLTYLGFATMRRDYERVGPEHAHLDRAKALQRYHQGLGLAGDPLDQAIALDLRQQLLDDLASVVPNNRKLTLRRYRLRARAVSLLLWSLLVAFLATILAIMTAKTGLLIKAAP